MSTQEMTTDEAVARADALRAYKAIKKAQELVTQVGRQQSALENVGEACRWSLVLVELDRAVLMVQFEDFPGPSLVR